MALGTKFIHVNRACKALRGLAPRFDGCLVLFGPVILGISSQFLELVPYFLKFGPFHILLPTPSVVFPANFLFA